MNRTKKENGADISGVAESVSPAELSGWRVRLKERYPELDAEDGAALDAACERYMTESESELGRYKEVEGQLTELCRVYPEFAELVYNMVTNKMPLRAAVAKVFSEEDLIAQDGDDDYDAYRKAYQERTESVKKRDARTQEIEANEAKSIETIDTFASEKGLSEEEKDGLTELINEHFTELLYKRITPEMLEGFLKQMSFETAVSAAEKTGEIRGKNQKIEALRVKEKSIVAGDGLPVAGGGGPLNPVVKPQNRNFFDLPQRKGI